jgi:hypothetical protein
VGGLEAVTRLDACGVDSDSLMSHTFYHYDTNSLQCKHCFNRTELSYATQSNPERLMSVREGYEERHRDCIKRGIMVERIRTLRPGDYELQTAIRVLGGL